MFSQQLDFLQHTQRVGTCHWWCPDEVLIHWRSKLKLHSEKKMPYFFLRIIRKCHENGVLSAKLLKITFFFGAKFGKIT